MTKTNQVPDLTELTFWEQDREETNRCTNVIDIHEVKIKGRSRVESDGGRVKARLGGQGGQL